MLTTKEVQTEIKSLNEVIVEDSQAAIKRIKAGKTAQGLAMLEDVAVAERKLELYTELLEASATNRINVINAITIKAMSQNIDKNLQTTYEISASKAEAQFVKYILSQS